MTVGVDLKFYNEIIEYSCHIILHFFCYPKIIYSVAHKRMFVKISINYDICGPYKEDYQDNWYDPNQKPTQA